MAELTADEFERQYAERSGKTVAQLRGRIVRPCSCGDEGCEGWQSLPCTCGIGDGRDRSEACPAHDPALEAEA